MDFIDDVPGIIARFAIYEIPNRITVPITDVRLFINDGIRCTGAA